MEMRVFVREETVTGRKTMVGTKNKNLKKNYFIFIF
jgi:hypothetical protein